jgi:hypothetical protein
VAPESWLSSTCDRPPRISRHCRQEGRQTETAFRRLWLHDSEEQDRGMFASLPSPPSRLRLEKRSGSYRPEARQRHRSAAKSRARGWRQWRRNPGCPAPAIDHLGLADIAGKRATRPRQLFAGFGCMTGRSKRRGCSLRFHPPPSRLRLEKRSASCRPEARHRHAGRGISAGKWRRLHGCPALGSVRSDRLGLADIAD